MFICLSSGIYETTLVNWESSPPYTTKTHHIYSLLKKSTYFYKESVMYPYVQVDIRKNKFMLSNEEYMIVDNFITASGNAHIWVLFHLVNEMLFFISVIIFEYCSI